MPSPPGPSTAIMSPSTITAHGGLCTWAIATGKVAAERRGRRSPGHSACISDIDSSVATRLPNHRQPRHSKPVRLPDTPPRRLRPINHLGPRGGDLGKAAGQARVPEAGGWFDRGETRQGPKFMVIYDSVPLSLISDRPRAPTALY